MSMTKTSKADRIFDWPPPKDILACDEYYQGPLAWKWPLNQMTIKDLELEAGLFVGTEYARALNAFISSRFRAEPPVKQS